MAPKKAAPRVKLRHRLPNAPPLFVGRAREIDWLELAIRRAPVAGITGPGGIGKTALVLHVLFSRFREQAARTVYFGIRPGEPTAQLRYDLARVLADVAREEIDLAALARDPEALTEATIDLAERAGLWVLLDDTHHAEVDEMAELLTQLVTYARASRWLITSRMEPPVAALRGQLLDLRAMAEGDLAELAHALSPRAGREDLHRAVVAASGSPWLLHQLIATGDAGMALTRERLVGDLPASTEPFMQTLALFRTPIAADVLAQLTRVPDAPALEALVRRGLVVETDAGLALHDLVAQMLYPRSAASPEDAARRVRAAAVLEAAGDAELLVEAARQNLEAGAFDALVTLLDAHTDALFAEAQAPRLFAVIRNARDRRLVRYQLRCAAELGNPTALGVVDAPRDPGPEEHLAWATTLYGKGEINEARALARDIRAAAESSDDRVLACDAALLEARCLAHQNDPARAARLLEAQAADAPGLSFRRDALLARCRAAARDPSADEALAELRLRGEAMSDGVDGLLDVAWALAELGRREGADEVLDLLLATPRGGRASLLISRQALVLRARIRLETGDVAMAREIVSSLEPYVRTTSLLRPFVMEIDAARRLAVGDLAGLSEHVQTAAREARKVDRALSLRLATLHERLSLVTLDPPRAEASVATTDAIDESTEGAVLAVVRARRALRAEGAASKAAPLAPVRVETALFDAERALAAGDLSLALSRADEALRESERLGSRLSELDALELALDVQLVADARERGGRARDALRELGQTLSSTRARLEADLAERFDDPGTLERIAPHVAHAPRAARRARALLGGAPPLDVVDRLVLEAFARAAPSLRVETVLGREPRVDWQIGWGLDARTRSVWLADGRVIDLSSRGLLWRFLETLVLGGGALSKEAIVLGVWEEREYHPGRHDPRLHMSARKLREAIEDDPGAPSRLLTTEDGYRLGGAVRRIAGA